MSSLTQLIADLPTATPSPPAAPPPPAPRPEARLPLDGPPPKPPALSWEERPAFREVFLMHFPPLAADALREAGRYLYDAALEHEIHAPAEPWVRAGVRAVAEDLRFSARVLAAIGDTPVYAGLMDEELRLAMKVEAWAAEVERIAEIMQAAVGPEPEPRS
jgi:hypothetical protein